MLAHPRENLLTPARRAAMRAVLPRRLAALTVVLDNVYDPHNLAAVLRSCDAFGVQDVHIITTYETFAPNPKVSHGAERWLTLHHWHSYHACFDWLRHHGFSICCTAISPAAVSVHTVPVDTPLALVFGNEHRGIRDDTRALTDALVTIPMFGFVESLNISVAAAVAIASLSTRLRARGGPEVHLSPARQQELYAAWVDRQTLTRHTPEPE